MANATKLATDTCIHNIYRKGKFYLLDQYHAKPEELPPPVVPPELGVADKCGSIFITNSTTWLVLAVRIFGIVYAVPLNR